MQIGDIYSLFDGLSTSTISSILIKNGIQGSVIKGARPISNDNVRAVGIAYTMRFIPARDDLLLDSVWQQKNSPRATIDNLKAGRFLVIDACGLGEAAPVGDLMCTRMMELGLVGLVTDGAVRDIRGILASRLPVWSCGSTPASALKALTLAGTEQPISCGGVAVLPGDVIVADADGVVVIPRAMAHAVAGEAREQEQFDMWAVEQLKLGIPLVGLYPPDKATLKRYTDQREQI